MKHDEFARCIVSKFDTLFDPALNSFWCECGEGWQELILCALSQLDWYNQTLSWFDETVPVQIVQIKEKYGELIIYTDTTSPYVQGIIDTVSYMSCRTCEVCGQPEVTRGSGWLKTLCDHHAEELGYPAGIETF